MLGIEYKMEFNAELRWMLETMPQAVKSGPAMVGVMREVGTVAANDLRTRFEREARPGGAFARTGMIGIITRERSTGSKMVTFSDIEARRNSVPALMDTMLMFKSLRGAAATISVDANQVTVGVPPRQDAADAIQAGGTRPWTFDAQKQKNFAKNVSATGNAKSNLGRRFAALRKAGSTERTSKRPRKDWNPVFFQLWNWLKSRSSITLQKREIVPAEPEAGWLERWTGVFTAGVTRIIQGGK